MVLCYRAGLVFDPLSESFLQQAVETVATRYKEYADMIRAIDLDGRDANQVQVYIDALSGRAF